MASAPGTLYRQFGNSAVRQFGSKQAVILALILLSTLVACTDPPKSSAPNKLAESESRFWRRPDSSARTTAKATARKDDSPPLNLEDPALPFEVSEKVGAELDIACGGAHPPVADITKAEPVQIGTEGDKGLLVTIRHACICSVTGNCPREVWTRDVNGHYQQTLADEAYELLLANTAHEGHYDVVTEAYLTARESSIVRYEWDGKQYRPAEQSCRVGDGDIPTRPISPGKCR